MSASFATVVGTGVASTSPTITTNFYIGQEDQLGSGITTSTGTGPLVVTDDLPAGATLETFTLTGPTGEIWNYSYNATTGAATLLANSGSTTMGVVTGETAAQAAASNTAPYVVVDQADGVITADYGTAAVGQVGQIAATFLGGEYQWKTGFQSQVQENSSGQYYIADVLPGGAVASSYTLDANGGVYVYTVNSNGTLTFDSADSTVPGGVGIGIGAGNANAAGQYVVYDATSNTFTAYLGNSSSVVNSSSVGASYTGGTLVNTSTQSTVNVSSSASGSGQYLNSNSAQATVAATLQPGQGGVPGATSLAVEALALQKGVTVVGGTLKPGAVLDYKIEGEVSNYTNVNGIVVTDVLGDGQTYTAGQNVTLDVANHGIVTEFVIPAADITVSPAKAADGSTTITFNVSQAIIDDGINATGTIDGTNNGTNTGAANFTINFQTTVDTNYAGTTEGYTDTRILQGDAVDNAASVAGAQVSNGATVGDSSSTQVSIPTGTPTKTIVNVDGVTPTVANGHVSATTGLVAVQTGDTITYQLQYVLPQGNADNVTLEDFFPEPMIDVSQLTAADITSIGGPALLGYSIDAANNELILNYGSVSDATYAPQTIDVNVTGTVTDTAFVDGLLKTNELTALETNSVGNTTTSSAIVQFQMAGPEVTIEKGVVATTDSHGVLSGTVGGVTWNTVGTGGFTGTIDTASLKAAPVNATLTNIGAGATSEIAIVAENTGSEAAFNVALTDSDIPAGLSYVAGSLHVVDGSGDTLSFTQVGVTAANPLGTIEITNSLAAGSSTNGSNIAVITFDTVTDTSAVVPNTKMSDTATITDFTAVAGDNVNRTSTESASQLSASTYIETAAPTVVKTFAGSSDGDPQTALKLGETGTYDITVTFPGGTASSVNIGDTLPTGMTIVSSTLESIGSDLTVSGASAGAVSTTGTFSLGTVTDAVDTRGANDQVVIQVVAVAGTASSAGNGSTEKDVGFVSEGSIKQTTTLTTTIKAPVLTLSKAVEDLTKGGTYSSSVTANAGDNVQYQVELANTGGASAFQVNLTDLMSNPDLTYTGIKSVEIVNSAGTTVLTGDTTADLTGFQANLGNLALAAGSTLEVVYDATVVTTSDYAATLPNTVTSSADTLPNTDVNYGTTGYNRNLTNSATADVLIASPTIAKTLSSASDTAAVSLPNVVQGETATFTVTTTLNEGASTDLSIIDNLPAGFVYNAASIVSIGTGITAANPNATATVVGNQVSIDLGATQSTGTNNVVTIAVTGAVENTTSLASGTTLTNIATVESAGSVMNTASATATVEQPHLVVTKTPSGVSGDAGQTVNYTVAVANTGSAPADDVVLTDTDASPADLALTGFTATLAGTTTAVAGTFSNTGSGFTFTAANPLAAGATIDINYTGTYTSAVQSGQTLDNSASATYSSLVTGGYAQTSNTATAAENVVLTPTITKTLLSSSDSILPTGKVEAGDQVVYQLAVTPGNGTQLLTVNDNLPTGLIFEGASLASAGGTTATLGALTDSGTGNNLILNLGTIVDPAGNTGSILIDVTADVAGNVTNGQTIDNTSSVTSSALNGAGSKVANSGTVDETVVTPNVTVDKTVSIASGTGDAGTVADFNVLYTNTGNGPAYDLQLTDLVATPGGMILGTPTASVAGTWTNETNAGWTFTPTVPLAAGQTIDITYAGTFSNAVTPGEVLDNTAAGTYQTSGGVSSTIAPSTASVDVVMQPSLVKSIVAISDGNLPAGEVQVGDTVTYQLAVTPGNGTSLINLSDVLPTGLSFVGQPTVVSAGGSTVGTLNVTTTGQTMDITSTVVDPAGNTSPILIDVTALVGPAATGSEINTGRVFSSAANGTTGLSNTVTSTAGVTVVAPDLAITKQAAYVSGQTGDTLTTLQAGDIVQYTVTVGEAAGDTNPAYDLSISDLLGANETLVGNVVASAGSLAPDGAGYVLNVGSLVSGQSPITITYDALIGNGVTNAEKITNTATLEYSTAPTNGAETTETASQTVTAAIPDSLTKTLVTVSQNSGDLVIPGETIDFNVTATLGHGTQNLDLTDLLPAGLTAVSATVVSEGDVTTGVAVGTTVAASGGVAGINFGTVVNPGNGTAAGSQVVIDVKAVVNPTTAVSTIVTNTATLVGTTSSGTPQGTITATASVDVVNAGTISSFVFFDAQCDGTYHVGDMGVAGVTVQLLDANGKPIVGDTTVTNAQGGYTFSEVIPGTYEVEVIAPAGISFSHKENASGNPLVDSDVNSQTGITAPLVVTANNTTQGANAGLIFNGNFAGTTPTTIGAGQTYDGNSGSGVIVGPGGDLVHVGNGGNNVVVLGGLAGYNIVEAGSGDNTDIVTSCGPMGAQTQNAANGFLLAGGAGSDLQGGSGNTYLMGGAGGDNLLANGSGNNILIPGGPNSEVRTGGASSTILYQVGDGALLVDNGLGSNDTLDVFGTSSGTLEIINGQEYLNLGNGDVVHFNGGTSFDGKTGVITNANAPSGIKFFASITTPPTESLVFGANGMPTIEPTGSVGTVTPAPTPAPTTVPAATPVPTSAPPSTPVPTSAPPSTPVPTTTTPITPSGHDVVLSGWNAVINLDDTAHAISGSQGQASITVGNGNNTIQAGGYNNLIIAGNGNNTISGPQGSTTVSVGHGANSITLSGYNNIVTATDGNNTIAAGDGSETVTTGLGNNTLSANGYSNVFSTAGGTNVITAGAGNDTVNTGAANDTVTLSGWSNLVTGGLGADTITGGQGNTYQITGAGTHGGMDITDFSVASNDVLDLSKVLQAVSASPINSIVQVAAVGGNDVVSVNLTGSSWMQVATLQGVTANLGDLVNHGAIKIH